MARVGIVTDSTCDLTPARLAALDVAMVPLKVLFGDEHFRDWIDLAPDEFYSQARGARRCCPRRRSRRRRTSRRPTPTSPSEGCERDRLDPPRRPRSPARSSRRRSPPPTSPVPVRVVDTKKRDARRSALIVKAALRGARRGRRRAPRSRRARVEVVARHDRLFFVLDTLDYLVKGGRAGKAQGLAASLLNIKPVLEVNADGIIEPFKKVKGRKKAHRGARRARRRGLRERNGRMRVALLHACCQTAARGPATRRSTAAGADVEIESRRR